MYPPIINIYVFPFMIMVYPIINNTLKYYPEINIPGG